MTTKLTCEEIDSHIVEVEYHTIEMFGKRMMFCGIKMDNGFVAVGEPSVCINDLDWDDVTGRDISYNNSYNELWKLEAYRKMAKDKT